MKIQNKKEIELSVEDITMAIMRYLGDLGETQNISLDSPFSIDFRVVNKPIRSGMYDTIDKFVFDGAKVVVLE